MTDHQDIGDRADRMKDDLKDRIMFEDNLTIYGHVIEPIDRVEYNLRQEQSQELWPEVAGIEFARKSGYLVGRYRVMFHLMKRQQQEIESLKADLEEYNK